MGSPAVLLRHLLPVSALLLALGALGPWAHGTYLERPGIGAEHAEARTVVGLAAGGAFVAVPALLIALLGWVAPARPAARGAIFFLLVLSAFVLLRAVANDGLSASYFDLRVSEGWSNVSLGWGILLALAAWLGVFAGCVAWAFEREDDEPAPEDSGQA